MQLRKLVAVAALVVFLSATGCSGGADKPPNEEILRSHYRIVIPRSWSLVDGSDANLSIWESPSGDESLAVTIIGHWEVLSDDEDQLEALERLIELEEESADECSEPIYQRGEGICFASCETTGWGDIPDSHASTVIITGPEYAVSFVYWAEGLSEAEARAAAWKILKTARIVL